MIDTTDDRHRSPKSKKPRSERLQYFLNRSSLPFESVEKQKRGHLAAASFL
jgi:hypothetical protein